MGFRSAGQETPVLMKPKVSPPFDYLQSTSVDVPDISFHIVIGSKFSVFTN